MESKKVKTSLLILSDTHAMFLGANDLPHQHVDVVIHCGDLTDGSQLPEYRSAIDLLAILDAPLKLVIGGNHDFALDDVALEEQVKQANLTTEPDLVAQFYGHPGDAKRLLTDAGDAGIVFLDEGTHRFTLNNGALLTVFASPYTPSNDPGWGFQYTPKHGHNFAIGADVDVVMTHGPPEGIMDRTRDKGRLGCPSLFAAIANAKPLVHCFGHVHQGWGAKLVTWREKHEDSPTNHMTVIDNERSTVIETLMTLRPSDQDSEQRALKLKQYESDRCCTTSHCSEDALPLLAKQQTLFVNASISGSEENPVQRPWLVNIELPQATVGSQ